MANTTAHIISHSHWDREWYLPFEKHRYYLVKLMDALLEKLENDPDYKSFHLDGQTIALDDYLEVRPEKYESVKKYIEENRIIIGPWYILQDAFLTSAEANVRNLMIGMNEAKKYGSYSKLGYFPDTFGIYGQAPQMLRQAGIDTAAFGRGVKPTGFNNMVSDSENFESPYSELEWQSPDGSSVLGVLFANWYSNGNEIPSSKEEAVKFWEQKLADAKKYASTPHLLYMNGCDHQPLQKDLPAAIKLANELYPDIEFKHSSFEEYMEEVKNSLPEKLQTVKGELRNQRTDGWSTLVNTASARIYLKQMNHSAQIKLERLVEPLAAFAYRNGEEYPEDYLRFAWKQLMQNHPHDSICGCSIDEVHEEMVTRFKKVDQIADMLIEEQAEKIAVKIKTTAPDGFDSAIPLIVMNTAGYKRHTTIEKVIDFEKVYFGEMPLQEIHGHLKNKALPKLAIVNAKGEEIPATIEDLGSEFGYDLPDDKFRQPYYTKKVKVIFTTEELSEFGYDTYFLVEKEPTSTADRMVKNDRTLENDYIRVSVHEDGTYDVLDKATGKEFKHIGSYEDTSDIGNEYMFKKATGEKAFTTKGLQAKVKMVENNASRGIIEISHSFEIPAAAHEELEALKDKLVWHRDREARRSNEMTTLELKTTLTLDQYAKGVAVKLDFDNTAKDHRLRVVYPTGFATDHHLAESAFEIVERPNKPEMEWSNPSFDHHQQSFASVSDGKNGLTVATKGLQEYEIVEEDTTLAITVLRAVSELGDWGYFPTPEAQCLGKQSAEWYVIPHAGDAISAKAYEAAYDFQIPIVCVQTNEHAGELAAQGDFIQWESDGLVLTSVKRGETSKDLFLRVYNPSNQEKVLTIHLPDTVNYYESNLMEEKVETIGKNYQNRPVDAYKIITVGMEGAN
ncbi:alpha-mannosidase [Lederbergia sp. NSJ-179]|uniref:alpha-mannosidase n=1 Tax=Lederbergia sp. NSJ-179 TaxID=2931402 RepID=UPI001FD09160|nr:alpha-mannosidase [Lederbergia sp. NSJ-179]MCJ7842237.1 alpha-mannosidase [Lederbergia sp. NSJ-179]